MKNVILFGYGKMGSSIAKGWLLKKLDFNFFVVEKQVNLREEAIKDGFNSFANVSMNLFCTINRF